MTDSAADGARRENFSAKDFLQAEAELTDLLNKSQAATARYKAGRKRWKGFGLDLKAYDAVQTLRRQDEADVLDDERTRAKYARWVGLELGFQEAFEFAPMTPQETEQRTKNDAIQMGYQAGRRGDPRASNPFADDPGNIGFAAWEEGWNQGDSDTFNAAAPTAPRQPTKGQGPEAGGGRKKAKDKPVEPVAEPQHDEAVTITDGTITSVTITSSGPGYPTEPPADPLDIPAFLKRTQ